MELRFRTILPPPVVEHPLAPAAAQLRRVAARWRRVLVVPRLAPVAAPPASRPVARRGLRPAEPRAPRRVVPRVRPRVETLAARVEDRRGRRVAALLAHRAALQALAVATAEAAAVEEILPARMADRRTHGISTVATQLARRQRAARLALAVRPVLAARPARAAARPHAFPLRPAARLE